MPRTGVVPAASAAAQQLAQQMGYEFVDAEIAKENGSVYLRIYVDHQEGLTIERLESFHRALLPYVEELNYDFLEVSSPGLDRPIKRARDFERAKGTVVEVRLYRSVNGARIYSGVLQGLLDDYVVIDNGEGLLRFPRTECALIKPVINFTPSKEDSQ